MSQDASAHRLETMELLWHVDTSACDNITRSTLASVDSLSYNVHSSWDMPNGNLVGRLLNFDLLVADEFA